jgi:hypothetical protein
MPIMPEIYDLPRTSVEVGLLPTGPMSFEAAVMSAMPGRINADGTITMPDYGEALEKLRKNGMSKEIDYSVLDKTMTMILSSPESHRYLDLTSPDVASDKASYLASTYSVLKQRINQDYSGEDLQRELSRLDAFMQGKIDRFSSDFADGMNEYRNMIGLESEHEKLSKSMKAVIYEQVGQYDAYLTNNYMPISDEDKWLLRHTDYISSHLRGAYNPHVTAQPEDLYSSKELTAMSEFARMSLPLWSGGSVMGGADEGVALRWGMTALKTDVLLDATGVSGEFKAAALNYTQKLIDDSIVRVSEAFMRSDGKTPTPLDEDVVRGIIDTMRKQYADMKNVSEAIEAGAAIAHKNFYEKLNSYGSSRTDRTNINAPTRYRTDTGLFAYLYRGGYGAASTLEQFNQSVSDMVKALRLSPNYQMDARF